MEVSAKFDIWIGKISSSKQNEDTGNGDSWEKDDCWVCLGKKVRLNKISRCHAEVPYVGPVE